MATSLEARIASVTARQHGVISIRQLLDLGLAHGQVSRRVRTGRLIRVHRGVYAIAGVPMSRRGHWMAAVLSGEEGTLLFGECALELHGVIRRPSGLVEIVTPGAPRLTPGIGVHRTRWLPNSQACNRHGIPTTTASRALVDYAYRTDAYELAGVLYELDFKRRLDLERVMQIHERLQHRRGVTDLTLAIRHYRLGSQGAYSAPELFLLRACRERGLPLPVANQPVETPRGCYIVDAVWMDRRFAYELDEKTGHGRPPAVAKDRERDEALISAGFRHIRIDINRMYGDIDGTVDRIAQGLRV